jgi:hypothetical protein
MADCGLPFAPIAVIEHDVFNRPLPTLESLWLIEGIRLHFGATRAGRRPFAPRSQLIGLPRNLTASDFA